MFTNPIGQMFNNKPEVEEKKKRRNKKKKISPEMSEESNPSLQGSKTDLNSAQPEPTTSLGDGLIDIVNEINTNVQPVVEEAIETIETKYEELPVEESTMKTILKQLSTNSENNAPIIEESWEQSNNQESAWESEVAAAPQAVDSVWEQMLTGPAKEATPPVQEEESGWESMLSDPIEEIDSEKTKYTEQFNISENTYNLVKEFYEDQKVSKLYGLLESDLLRYLLVNSLGREELEGVTEEDVNRAIKAVDADNDNKVTFDEFIQLLSLFFSSKNNIKQRITGVLNNVSEIKNHEKSGSLTTKEANNISEILNNFYGKPENEEVEEEEKGSLNFLQKMVKKILNRNKVNHSDENDNNTNEEQSIDFDTYATEAANELETFLFVKFKF